MNALFNRPHPERVSYRVYMLEHGGYSPLDITSNFLSIIPIVKGGKVISRIGWVMTGAGTIKSIFGLDSEKLFELYKDTYGEDYEWDSIEDAQEAVSMLKKELDEKEDKRERDRWSGLFRQIGGLVKVDLV